MNPEQKRNPIRWWVAGLILFTMAFSIAAGFIGHAIQQKQERFIRDNRYLEKKISSVMKQIDGLQGAGPVSVFEKTNPAEVYSMIVRTAEQSGMEIENFSWRKAGIDPNGQTSPSENKDGLSVEINMTGHYRNFTRFLLTLSENPEYQLIHSFVLTPAREGKSSTQATVQARLKMIIPN